ncbi:hypothetical protein BGW80DRAFT_1346633 [Lactifluus volemus]|nr:hypothetical protein BGW80DRAFT_1346633 [Lactifluus volemus]
MRTRKVSAATVLGVFHICFFTLHSFPFHLLRSVLVLLSSVPDCDSECSCVINSVASARPPPRLVLHNATSATTTTTLYASIQCYVALVRVAFTFPSSLSLTPLCRLSLCLLLSQTTYHASHRILY